MHTKCPVSRAASQLSVRGWRERRLEKADRQVSEGVLILGSSYGVRVLRVLLHANS